MPHDIFISHSSKDKNIADAICNKLESEGIKCWIAHRDISPTKIYSGELIRAIEESRILVLIHSSHANSSRHVLREVQRADDQKVKIITFRIENVDPSPDLKYFIELYQWIEAWDSPIEDHIEKLFLDISNILGHKRIIEAEYRIPSRPLFGREENIVKILKMLKNNSLAVTGMKGIGKSKVVSALFDRVRDDLSLPFKTCYWRRFDSDEPPSFSDFGRQLLKDLANQDIDFDQLDKKDQIKSALQILNEKSCFLVIDQFETVVDPNTRRPKDDGFAKFLESFNHGMESSRLVLTSWEVPKDSRGVPLNHVVLSGLDESAGIKFMERASGEELSEDKKEILKVIVAKLKGHSYALELIAKNYSLSEIEQMINDPSLWDPALIEIASQIVTSVCKKLSPESKQVLTAACIFLKPSGRKAISFVSDEKNIFNLLSDLRQRGLIIEVQNGVYDIHILVKEHILSELSDKEKNELHLKAASYYRSLPCPPPKKRNSINDVEPILDAIEHLISANENEKAARLFIEEQLPDQLYCWSHFIYLDQIYNRFINKGLPEDMQADFLGRLGFVHRDLLDYLKAQDHYERALELARKVQNKNIECALLVNLGDIHHYLGDKSKKGLQHYKLSLSYHNQAVELLKEIGDRKLEARNTGCLGNTYKALSYGSIAKNLYLKAVQLSREVGDRRYEGIWLGDLANVYQEEGAFGEAIRNYKKALEIAKETQDKRHESWWLGVLGNLYARMNELEKAWAHLKKALSISEEIFYRKGISQHLRSIGNLHFLSKEYSKAIEYYEKSLKTDLEVDNRQNEDLDLSRIADSYTELEQIDKATEYYSRAVAAAKREDKKENEIHILAALATVFIKTGKLDKAIDCFIQAKKSAREMKDAKYAEDVRVLFQRSFAIYLKELLKEIDSLNAKVAEKGDLERELDILFRLGDIYALLNLVIKAKENYVKALNISIALGYKKKTAILLSEIADHSSIFGQFEESKKYYREVIHIAKEIVDQDLETLNVNRLSELLLFEANHHYSHEEYEKSIKRCREALELMPNLDRAYEVQGAAYQKSGRQRDDKELLKKGVECYTQAMEIIAISIHYQGRANCHAYLGNIDEAIADYSKAVEIDPLCVGAMLSKMEVQIWQGKYSESRKTYQSLPLQVLLPYEILLATWLMCLALCLDGMPYQDHLTYLKESPVKITARAYDPGDMEPFLNRLKETQVPKDQLENALSIHNLFLSHYKDEDPRVKIDIMKRMQSECFLNEANFLAKVDDLEEAVASCTKAIEKDPIYAPAYGERGMYHLKMAETPDNTDHHLNLALEDFTKAIEIEPHNGSYYRLRGDSLSLKDNFQDADRDYQKAIDLLPLTFREMAIIGKMKANICNGKYEEAIQDFERLSGNFITPRNYTVASYLMCTSLALSGKLFDKYIEPLEKPISKLRSEDWNNSQIDKHLERLEKEGTDSDRLTKAKEIRALFKSLFVN
jgi:tetratricopeptide (TPR) repeat protein